MDTMISGATTLYPNPEITTRKQFSLISAELSDDCVSKFTSLVRARD